MFHVLQDPAGISALLNSLRSSQAWADLQANASSSQTSPENDASPSRVPPAVQADSISTTVPDSAAPDVGAPSVASLLSQLSAPSHQPAQASSSHEDPSSSADASTQGPALHAVRERKQDTRGFTFQQSLPHLTRLSDDPSFVAAVAQLRKEQDDLERQLWEERQAVVASQEDRVKVAVTKANMTGSGISEREANAMRQGFERELAKFDKDRVLLVWDGLITRQQAALESLGVPTMFNTTTGLDRERQQRVVQVLEGITGRDD